MTPIVLVGLAPGPNTNPDLPLFPSPSHMTGGRLLTLTGLSRRQYLTLFDRVNLLPYFPGKDKRDDKFPVRPAKLSAQVMKPFFGGRTVILVGRNVAESFGLTIKFHEWTQWRVRRYTPFNRHLSVATLAIIPHPSGRNLWYNDPDNKAESARFWENFAERINELSFVLT